jgi:hypothetical protein
LGGEGATSASSLEEELSSGGVVGGVLSCEGRLELLDEEALDEELLDELSISSKLLSKELSTLSVMDRLGFSVGIFSRHPISIIDGAVKHRAKTIAPKEDFFIIFLPNNKFALKKCQIHCNRFLCAWSIVKKWKERKCEVKQLKKPALCGIIAVEVYRDGKIFNGYA